MRGDGVTAPPSSSGRDHDYGPIHLSNIIDPSLGADLNLRPQDPAKKACLAYVSEDGSLEAYTTYEQARKHMSLHRAWLTQKLAGLRRSMTRNTSQAQAQYFAPSTVIAYISSNTADFFFSVLACCSDWITPLSCIPALLNTRWTAREMEMVLKPPTGSENDATLILYGPQFEQIARQVVHLLQESGFRGSLCLPIPEYSLKSRTLATNGEPPVSSFPSKHVSPLPIQETIQNLTRDAYNNKTNDDALVLFTSGTTSGAKGVRLGHRALLLQAMAKLAPPCEYSFETAMLASTLPFYHVGGLTSILAIWLAGGTILLRNENGHNPSDGAMTNMNRPFDAKFVWRSLQKKSCNTLVVVPAMLHAMQRASSEWTSKTFAHVRLVLIGGQSASPAMLQFLRQHFPHARLVQTYACTEAASSLTFHDLNRPARTLEFVDQSISPVGDCVGKSPSHVELALLAARSADFGSRQVEHRPFHVGLIATRGPHLMNGYWKRASQPAPNLEKTRWFATNDLGYIDKEGYLFFCGRANDTVRTGGETVLSLEVERAILKHPGIDEAAVFPLPDDKFGEIVACALVVADKSQSSEPLSANLATIKDWCKSQNLAGYKCPKRIFVLKALPRNSSGKVVKAKLKQLFSTTKQEMQSKL